MALVGRRWGGGVEEGGWWKEEGRRAKIGVWTGVEAVILWGGRVSKGVCVVVVCVFG